VKYRGVQAGLFDGSDRAQRGPIVSVPDSLQSFATIMQRDRADWHWREVPDDVLILPAYGAGSLCGAHLSDKPSSTLGEQRTANPYLRITSRSEYIAAVLSELPETPQYFSHNAAMNREGPSPADWATHPSSSVIVESQLQGVVRSQTTCQPPGLP